MDEIQASSGDLIADRRYCFGRDLLARGDIGAAVDLFAQAVEAAPGFAAAWLALGEARQWQGDHAGAAAAFRRALAVDPADNCGAALRLARLGGIDFACAMSPAYVRGLFEQYAPRFEAALEALAYCGPARLREAVGRVRPGERFRDTLDLGCGSGLAGAVFRPVTDRLSGVDLSAAMLEHARAKKIYDRLETGDLMAFLQHETSRYDLVIAADVFVYFYDLAPVVAAVARVVEPGGIFAFTVEAAARGVELGEKLRFRHGADHLRAALAAFRVAELSPVATRMEAGAEVPGLLAVAIAAGK